MEDIDSLNVYSEAKKVVSKAKDIKDESIKDWLPTFSEASGYKSNLKETIDIFSDENATKISALIGLSIEMEKAPTSGTDDVNPSPIFSNEEYIKDTVKPLVIELFGE